MKLGLMRSDWVLLQLSPFSLQLSLSPIHMSASNHKHFRFLHAMKNFLRPNPQVLPEGLLVASGIKMQKVPPFWHGQAVP